MAFSSISRNEEYLEELMAFIRSTYALPALNIKATKRGFYGETWRLNTTGGSYFIKLDYSEHKAIYKRSFPIIEHLCSHGIDFISRIVKTVCGELFTYFDSAVLGVFEWIDGENTETDETKIPEYSMLAKVFTIPCDGLAIPQEDFSGDSAGEFFARWDQLSNMLSDEAARLCEVFENRRAELERRAERLRLFADRCSGDNSGYVITHGDAGGNLIKNGDKYYVVDWDAPMLAPPERDAWVMCPKQWARDAFNSALKQVGIDYVLRPERLGYNCYHTFFFYLNEYLDCFASQKEIVSEIEQYFESWAEERIRYADTLM